MSEIEKNLLQFWKIEDVCDRNGESKVNKKSMYESWCSDMYFAYGIRPEYYDKDKYMLMWDAFYISDYGMEETSCNHTSLVEKMEETENGFVAYTANSEYRFVKIDVTYKDIVQLLNAQMRIFRNKNREKMN